MTSSAWIAATTGQPPLAAQVNQLLVTHPATYVYTGVEQNHLPTAGSGSVASNGTWIAQLFTPSLVFTTGRVVVTLAVTGTPAPLMLGVYSNVSSAPGVPLVGPVALPAGFVGGSAAAVSVPLPGLTVASGTAYWLVAQAVGDASDFFSWSKANGTSGAMTSANGTSWTAQAYNLLFQVWDNTVLPPLLHTWEDAGARWSTLGAYNGGGQPGSLQEYTVAQGTGQYLYSNRAFSYSGSVLTSVA